MNTTSLKFQLLLRAKMLGHWLDAKMMRLRTLASIFVVVSIGVVAFGNSLPVDLLSGTYRDVFFISEHMASPLFVSETFATLNAVFVPIILTLLVISASLVTVDRVAMIPFPATSEPFLVNRANAGCSAAAFALFEQCQRSGDDFGAKVWLQRAARNGHAIAKAQLGGSND